MGWIYFAGESLACLEDTAELASRLKLVWRPPIEQAAHLQPGDRFLLAFWRGPLNTGTFTPIGLAELGAADQPVSPGNQCLTVIPSQLRKDFLDARPGRGGKGYRASSNSGFAAIQLKSLEEYPTIGQDWFGFNRGATGRKALWRFDSGRLSSPPIGRRWWP